MKKTFLALALLVGTQALAETPAMIEIGGGISAVNNEPIHAIFRVRSNVQAGERDQFIVARIELDGGIGGGTLNYADLTFRSLGWEWHPSETSAIGLTFLNVNFNRDIALNDRMTASVSLIGLTGSQRFVLNDALAIVLNGAMDVIGYGIRERMTDRQRVEGFSSDLRGEVGVELHERFRMVIGGRASRVQDESYNYPTGNVICQDYYDEYYQEYRRYCDNEIATGWNLRSTRTSAYLGVTAELTQNIRGFLSADYIVYSMSDELARFANSRNAGWRFRFGFTWRK